MGTTTNKLSKLLDTKENIKLAIESKGVTVGNIPFSQYPEKISGIQSGGQEEDFIKDIPAFLEEKLLEAISLHEPDDYTIGNIYGFPANEDNMTAISNNWSTSSSTIYIYSDNEYCYGKHTHTFDTSRDLITGSGKMRYRICLIKNSNMNISSGFEIIKCLKNGIDFLVKGSPVYCIEKNVCFLSDIFECFGLYYHKIIDCRPSYNLSGMAGYRGVSPKIVSGFNYEGVASFKHGGATDIKNFSNIYMNQVGFEFYNSEITVDSIIEIFKGLLPVTDETTHTVKFEGYSTRMFDLLTPEQIQIATDKGWTVTK